MYPITVVNKHHGTKGEYIGRGNPLGNPYIIGKDGTREEVIIKYRNWMISEGIYNPTIRKEFIRLHKLAQTQPVNLVCFCAPQACHGDIIKAILEQRI